MPSRAGSPVASLPAPRLYNTLSQKKEPFQPLREGEVRMYVCGPTVYDACHLGHARSYVVFDVAARYLRSLGYKVRLAINFTDVDERITERAKGAGEDPLKFAEARIGDFFREMDALGIMRADTYPRVSGYMPQMIKVVEQLMERGLAYRLGDRIYFDVEKAGGYGSLLHARPEDSVVLNHAGKGIEPSRRGPFDFELWDGTAKGNPLWDSPWGKGRIGWHVECYTMSKVLGHPLDITGGGVDLIFPHHESTRLIALALGQDLARFYVHNGFLTLGVRKMSKTGGIYITIRDALKTHSPETLRFFLLGTHYRQNLPFSDHAVAEAGKRLARIKQLSSKLKEAAPASSADDRKLLQLMEDLREGFSSSMDDDLDTPGALQALADFAEKASMLSIGPDAAGKALEVLGSVGEVLGFKWV